MNVLIYSSHQFWHDELAVLMAKLLYKKYYFHKLNSIFLVTASILLSACASNRTEIVLLPSKDQTPSAVVVYGKKGEILLDQPYAAVDSSGSSEEKVLLDEKKVQENYSQVLDALPIRPERIILYFKENTNELVEESRERLLPLLREAVAKRQAPEVSIIGYTDSTGSDEINERISLERAKVIYDFLVQENQDFKAEVAGRGKRHPLIPTPNGVSEPRNRRVEVTIR